jgi:hypothetical protein
MTDRQACASCGEASVAGKPAFAGRRTIEMKDGGRSYLCASCQAEIAAVRRGGQLTDDETRQLVETGGLAGMTWSGGSGIV